MSEPTRALTALLLAWRQGDAGALERIAAEVQAEFLRIAGSRLRGAEGLTLGKGDVVNEVWLRLLQAPKDWASREHFFAHAAMTIRSVLVDHARRRSAEKRGGRDRVFITLSDAEVGEESMAADLLMLDSLLDQLSRKDPRAGRVVELTYFVGLDREETAVVLDISVPTVDRELRFARAWLGTQMGRELHG